MGKKSSIYLSDELREKLRSPPRGPSAAIAAIIDRYTEIILSEKDHTKALFDDEEWSVLKAASSKPFRNAAAIRSGRVLANVQNLSDPAIEMHGADRKILEKKISKLNIVQQFALVELIEEMKEVDS